MAVPSFQAMLGPLLDLCSDGAEHTLGEAYPAVAAALRLSATDRDEMLESGRQTRFENRVQWAKCHPVKALALQPTGRATFAITDRGRDLVRATGPVVTAAHLAQYPEYQDFRKGSERTEALADTSSRAEAGTPRETLEAAYQSLRAVLADDLLARVLVQSPEFFEQLVVDLLVAMGYGGSLQDAGKAFQRSHDAGVDGVIKEDRLGLDMVYVQAKRWQDPVGRPAVQGFAGSLMGLKARKGVLLTTSTFTRDARAYVDSIQERNIVLIDGAQLAQLMIEHDIGVSEVGRYVVKQIDSDYFGDAQ